MFLATMKIYKSDNIFFIYLFIFLPSVNGLRVLRSEIVPSYQYTNYAAFITIDIRSRLFRRISRSVKSSLKCFICYFDSQICHGLA